MNILVFSWRDPKHPMAGGAEQVMHEHMKGWIKAGNKVTLFASRIKGYSKKEETLDGVKIIRMGAQIIGVNLLAPIWYLFLRKEKYDLVVDQIHGIGFMAPLYVKGPKLAVLQEVARRVWMKNHLPFPLNILLGGAGYFLEPAMFLLYKKIPFMVGSDSARQDLIKMGISDQNITIVPHGVIINKPKGKIEKEKIKTVVFLGALSRDKGIEDAIKAFSILNKKEDYQFWVIGKGSEEYLSHLKNLTRKNGLMGKVVFRGFVSQKKKFELLAKSHIMVNPSIMEGWGLVNIEASAMGVPVVAYRSPGLVDSVKDGMSGIILTKNTPMEMAKEVSRLVKSSERLKKISDSSVEWSRVFSWEKSASASLKLLSKIVN